MKALLLTLCFITINAFAQNSLNSSAIPSIIESYKANQARFGMDYKGKTLDGEFDVLGVKEEIFDKGTYYVEMSAMGKTVFCSKIFDAQSIALLPNLNKGMRVKAVGKIRDVAYGQLHLDGCTLRVIK